MDLGSDTLNVMIYIIILHIESKFSLFILQRARGQFYNFTLVRARPNLLTDVWCSMDIFTTDQATRHTSLLVGTEGTHDDRAAIMMPLSLSLQ